MIDMKWWQDLMNRATDNELEQAASALHEDVFGWPTRTHMHRAVVAELGKRSKKIKENPGRDAAGFPIGMITPMPNTPMRSTAKVLWTSHGHYAGDGEPTEIELSVRPLIVTRCGGPGMCAQCSQEASGRYV